MAKNDDLLLPSEMDAPRLIKRFIKLFRKHKGSTARRNTKASREWFYQNLSKRSEVSADQLMESWRTKTAESGSGLIGKMYLFKYFPKHADTLPYYDTAPLVFFFNAFVGDGEYGEKGVTYLLGINMHYMTPKMRVYVLETLMKLRSEKRYRASTRLKITWRALKALGQSPVFNHSVKMYRADHFISELHEISPSYWEMVVTLPIAEFKKASNKTVWADIGRK